MNDGTEQFFEAWKKQVETSARIMDAVVDGTAKLRTAQLTAAKETHERTQALEKALADAKSAQELWGAQWNWALASCERSAAYWRSLFEAMTQANGDVARCMQDVAKGAVPAQSGDGMPSTGFPAMDNAYRDMLKTSQQLLQYTASAFGGTAPMAKPDRAANAGAKKAA